MRHGPTRVCDKFAGFLFRLRALQISVRAEEAASLQRPSRSTPQPALAEGAPFETRPQNTAAPQGERFCGDRHLTVVRTFRSTCIHKLRRASPTHLTHTRPTPPSHAAVVLRRRRLGWWRRVRARRRGWLRRRGCRLVVLSVRAARPLEEGCTQRRRAVVGRSARAALESGENGRTGLELLVLIESTRFLRRRPTCTAGLLARIPSSTAVARITEQHARIRRSVFFANSRRSTAGIAAESAVNADLSASGIRRLPRSGRTVHAPYGRRRSPFRIRGNVPWWQLSSIRIIGFGALVNCTNFQRGQNIVVRLATETKSESLAGDRDRGGSAKVGHRL